MMDAFNKAGIQVMVDIVPNHSSDDHVWFQEALKSPKGSAARDRYIFVDGKLVSRLWVLIPILTLYSR
jgi:alpha-glucosidase